MIAASSPATWERPPVSTTMPVRGGLALTGNAPNKPASRLPAPAPRKSRSTSAGWSGAEGNDRVVADVCTMTTTAIRKASGTSLAHCSAPISGIEGIGIVPEISPITCTPFASSPAEATYSVEATSAMSAPGMRALIRSHTITVASTPKPMMSVWMLVLPSPPARPAIRANVGPPGDGSPSTLGNCETMMCTAMPARKPTVTGTDNRFAMPPSRKPPASTSRTPTSRASAAARLPYSGVPVAASKAKPAAKIGVIVESAPQDRKRLAPNRAKPSEPAMKAKKPVSGVKPPSLAVAICSGIAIAASVSPAARSAGTELIRHPASERSKGQCWPSSLRVDRVISISPKARSKSRWLVHARSRSHGGSGAKAAAR